uniref:GlxA family transcriptional regulator n=1 Tax=uncultured Altererythrobacter sp. TaxID=500840 RepID=UPI002604654A|nr:helix-turn-helix domain-containing protein [uncultured Altererythrobacter sp.]
MPNIVILAYDKCMAGAVTAPADLFATANHIMASKGQDFATSPPFSVVTASLDGDVVKCGNGQMIMPDAGIDAVVQADLIIVPGLLIASEKELLSSLAKLEKLSPFLNEMHEQGSVIAAGCTGSFVLAEAGLLDSLEATTTWWLAEAFCGRYPRVRMRTKQMVVEQGRLITAAAGTSYLDLSLMQISRFAGPHVARQSAAFLCIDGPRESQTAYAIPHHRLVRDPFIETADNWIRENISRRLDVESLASHLGVSARTLIRRFRSTIGQPPSDYIQSVRIDHAKYLLQNTRAGISQVAVEVGYQDEDAFRRAFKKLASSTPTAFRQRSADH